MRIYVAVITVVALALIFGIYTVNTLSSNAEEIVCGFDDMEKAIEAEKWEDAEEYVVKARERWGEVKRWWPMVIDHQEIDNIDMAFARIDKYIAMRDRTMSYGELAVLRQMLEHIPDMEKVNLKNIL